MSRVTSWADPNGRVLIRAQLDEAAITVAGEILTTTSAQEQVAHRRHLERIYTRRAVLDLVTARDDLAYQKANLLRRADGKASLRAMATILAELRQSRCTIDFGLHLAKSWAERAKSRQMFCEELQGPDEALVAVARLMLELPADALALHVESLGLLVDQAKALPMQAALGWTGEPGTTAFWDTHDAISGRSDR